LAAKIMRDLLVDHARQARAAKRGGGNYSLSLSEADRVGQQQNLGLLALDQAMMELAAIKPRHCQIIEMRFFAGLTIEETAEVLNISHATVERDWSFARAWLYNHLANNPNSAGKTWTQAEKEAGANATRQLTQDDPAPQTIYRVAVKSGSTVLVNVGLRYVRSPQRK